MKIKDPLSKEQMNKYLTRYNLKKNKRNQYLINTSNQVVTFLFTVSNLHIIDILLDKYILDILEEHDDEFEKDK